MPGRDDSEFYGQVAKELSSGFLEPAAWTEALAKSGGEENRAKALYIKLRVKRLKTEETAAVRVQREEEARKRREERRVLTAGAARGQLTREVYKCPNCGFHGQLKIVERGDGCICVLLLLLLVIPGILYAAFSDGYSGVCPKCDCTVVPKF